MKFVGYLLVCIAAGFSYAQANEFFRPKNSVQYASQPEMTVEVAQSVQGGQVAWADYFRLREDFRQLRNLTENEINKWLIDNFCRIGQYQENLNGIRNTKIPVDKENLRPAYRPETWKRGAALEARDPLNQQVIGMVDVKGIGHGAQSVKVVDETVHKFKDMTEQGLDTDPIRISDHSDGLLSLGEAVAEVTRQKAAQKLFNLHGVPLETVESYAIISLPIRILKDKGSSIPAALYLRQAHLGRESLLPVPSRIFTDPHGARQLTSSGAAVDFGGVMITEESAQGNFSQTLSSTNLTDSQSGKPWAWGHDAATAFDNGDKNAIKNHIIEMLLPIENNTAQMSLDERAQYLNYKKRFEHFIVETESMPLVEKIKAVRGFNSNDPYYVNYIEKILDESDQLLRKDTLNGLRGSKERLLKVLQKAMKSALKNSNF